MFSEIVQGLVSRTQRDNGVDQNSPEEKLVPCSVRIGIISAGDFQPMDVCSVHHNTFLRYSISLLGYGFSGDVLADSKRKRWTGPARYDFSGFKTFLTHHHYEGAVSFLPATDIPGTPRDKTRCRAGDNGVDQNSPEEKLVPCSLHIDIIPAGSTDCICYATVGINDPVTSALHVIVGDSQPMDVCSVHHNNTFLRYSVSLLGYGFYGDVLADSERKRWMGPARYDFSGFKTFLTHHHYEGAVSFLPETDTLGTPRDKTRCRAGCFICQRNGQLYSGDSPEESKTAPDVSDREYEVGWGVVRGKFLAVNAASMSCACPRSPKGLSPAAQVADGTTDLILVRKCSRFNFLRHLLRHTSKDDQFDMTFVEVHRVRRFRFTPRHCQNHSELDLRENGKQLFSQICRDHPACSCSPAYSSWNCDGEILPHAAIEVGVHCQLIKLFARGIEEQPLFEDLVCTLGPLVPPLPYPISHWNSPTTFQRLPLLSLTLALCTTFL
ncbi:ceramide kinase-like isoform X2 [Salvelinus fontinalis]|uniref:ceramide kinase-like isoform X2 n=1 Tax=Salvelinus fontinalis TaxID=8038 RepID=UPI002485467C|nr:ceramide kinase-like isoform X2 [Salvelinus fontinalis]